MNIFIAFANQDRDVRDKLLRQMKQAKDRMLTLALMLCMACKSDTDSQILSLKSNDPFEGQMLLVAGGTFQMGSPATEKDRYDDECLHTVAVGTFYMGKYEVTQAQWRAVMKQNPSFHLNCEDCPVENVSWTEVQNFINAVNQKTGRTYRLPTEAEWEYAAKGGKQSKGYIYAGSNTLDSVTWYQGNSGSKIHSVGGKAHNELGLYDMSGNVWEWCQDSWMPYLCDSKTTADGRYRVLRGGSAFFPAPDCRAAHRSYVVAALRNGNLGFRLCSSSLQ